jgi:hypothetical protein
MITTSLKHLRDEALLRRVAELVANGWRNTADLLVHLAEVESRQLHLRAGYDSMKAYLIGEFHFSEDAGRKRVHAMHVAAKHPVLFEAIADGRLHLTAVTLLASYLTPENAAELVAAATRKTAAEIDIELARRFPRAEILRLDDGVSPQVIAPQAPDPVGCALKRTEPPPKPRTRIAAITAQRFTLQVSIEAEAHDDLRAVQALLGHAVPSGDVGAVVARALKIARAQLERRKFARVARPRPDSPASDKRTIPAHVKRAVFERDGDRCAYIGEQGHRCGSRVRLEFDHVVPVARGGGSTVDNVRLVCRVHNQFAADRAFGREFMDTRRELARG